MSCERTSSSDVEAVEVRKGMHSLGAVSVLHPRDAFFFVSRGGCLGKHALSMPLKANKNFEMLFVRNTFHGESREHASYLIRRRWDYFVQYLLGMTPPADFEIKEDRDPLGSGRRRRR